MKRKVALFDFDGTLTRHDTLVTFAVHAVGRRKFFWAMCWSLPWIVGWKCGILSNSKACIEACRYHILMRKLIVSFLL